MHTFARGREPSGAPGKRSRGISRHVVALGDGVGRALFPCVRWGAAADRSQREERPQGVVI